jgi:hypothetical protein
MRFQGFIGGSNVLSSVIADAEKTVNWYVERNQSKAAKSPASLFPTPGFNPFTTLTDVGGRAAVDAGGRKFILMGATLFEVNSDGTFSNRGAVAQDSNPAQMFYNGTVGGQIGIASGANFYSYVLSTNTLALQLTGTCNMSAYASGYFFAFNLSTGKVLLSALNDGTSWGGGGTFFQRSLFADPWQAFFVDGNNLLWLIGTESFEVWYNTGVGTQPWAPLSGLNGLYGIAAPFAFCRSPIGNFWLSANNQGQGQLLLSSGGLPQPVSTYAFSNAVAGFLHTSKISDAEMIAYQQMGHTFAVVTFPSVPATWVYDATEQGWAERGVWNSPLGRFDPWAPRIHLPAFGKNLVASRTSQVVCDMNPAYTTEFDGVTGVVRERTTPGLTQEHARIPIDQLELLMDVGATPIGGTAAGSNPQITLRTSFDGGRTFGNERMASMGKMGEFRRRVYWNQIGAPPDVVLKVRSSDPAPSRIIDAFVNNIEPLVH